MFVRVRRSAIMRRRSIRSLRPDGSGAWSASLESGAVRIGRTYLPDIKASMKASDCRDEAVTTIRGGSRSKCRRGLSRRRSGTPLVHGHDAGRIAQVEVSIIDGSCRRVGGRVVRRRLSMRKGLRRGGGKKQNGEQRFHHELQCEHGGGARRASTLNLADVCIRNRGVSTKQPFSLERELPWVLARMAEKPDISLRSLLAELCGRGDENYRPRPCRTRGDKPCRTTLK